MTTTICSLISIICVRIRVGPLNTAPEVKAPKRKLLTQAVTVQPLLHSGICILLKAPGLVWKRGWERWTQRTLLIQATPCCEEMQETNPDSSSGSGTNSLSDCGQPNTCLWVSFSYLRSEMVRLVPRWCPAALPAWKCPNTTTTNCLVSTLKRQILLLWGLQPQAHKKEIPLSLPIYYPQSPLT